MSIKNNPNHPLILFLAKHNHTLYSIAKLSGLPTNSLYKMVSRNSSPSHMSIHFYSKISKALGISIDEMYTQILHLGGGLLTISHSSNLSQ